MADERQRTSNLPTGVPRPPEAAEIRFLSLFMLEFRGESENDNGGGGTATEKCQKTDRKTTLGSSREKVRCPDSEEVFPGSDGRGS